MKVKLRELRPNPLRDFQIDPVDEEAVDRLRASISEYGFWGGVVCREKNGHKEIAAGHHRVEAAIREGVEEGDVHVAAHIDDRTMIRIYAEENATQRGTADSTARAGSVAAALRMAAYDVLTGTLSGNPEKVALSHSQGNITSERGIGQDIVLRYLEGVPGITRNTVNEDLASLKKGGEYARILAEVRDRIRAERQYAERQAEEIRETMDESGDEASAQAAASEAKCWEDEAAAARESEERAEKAAAKAAEKAATFDFKGVAPILKTAHHLQSFRDVVTSDLVRPYLHVDQQAVIAERIVALAREGDEELTGFFIRSNVMAVVTQFKEQERHLAAAEKEQMLRSDWARQSLDLQEHYLGGLRNVVSYGERLLKHLESAPAGLARPRRASYESNVLRAREIIVRVEEGL